MGVLGNIEIRPTAGLSKADVAAYRDNYVREFDRQFRQWTDIARCCLDVKRDEDWRTLGFDSFTTWITDAAPCSRRYLFLVMGIYEDLTQDIPPEQLDQIPLGSGAILHRQVKSRKVRRDPRVIEAAKQKPKQLTAALQELAPLEHVEGIVRQVINFTQSQWDVINTTFEKYQVMVDPDASLASFIEFLCSEINEWVQHAEPVEATKESDATLA